MVLLLLSALIVNFYTCRFIVNIYCVALRAQSLDMCITSIFLYIVFEDCSFRDQYCS